MDTDSHYLSEATVTTRFDFSPRAAGYAGGDTLARGLKQLGAGHFESTPVQTAFTTFTPQREAMDAKRAVEPGSSEG